MSEKHQPETKVICSIGNFGRCASSHTRLGFCQITTCRKEIPISEWHEHEAKYHTHMAKVTRR